ncbi:unnamed protein product [Tilletia laevis]|uniref:NADH:ubiquinone oxidoreductase intermediate-associated protein 30 domain-containing protein n=4 Tax=Tilletia TaxID=13289 RepID=A0A8X7MRG5_9BASI|nr:hypothetical protein CF336_g5017 [Tilletia laevis]KAE8194820.1 hypothetical protein CF328_g4630 [Tilletia controversa]KAE8258600.1 hypothetical protein A4X03_0g4328 [Tilletia caries]KAE8245650.1 hypothetical protein A4X06_0g5521 [Tilletia controversa]CAD6885263.1 unnamed protein product [Tilletia caries]
MRATSASYSLGKQLHAALRRSIDTARDEAVKVMRFEALESRAELSKHALPLYSFTSPPPSPSPSSLSSSGVALPLTHEFATGSDIDIGGLSTMRFAWDPTERAARFWGTLSSDIPRGAKIERSGYAAFRNKNRPTLFGVQTWDTTMHPYLAIKLRNRRAAAAASQQTEAGTTPAQQNLSQEEGGASSSLRSAADAAFQRGGVPQPSSDPSAILAHAIDALGLNLAQEERPGPRFFVNIQTDGPVTSDLFQHRLFLDPSKLDEWQTVIIPFDSFVLTNTGTVTLSPLTMMREKIRTIGISAVLDVPAIPHSARATTSSSSSSTSSSTKSASGESSPSSSSTKQGPDVLRKRAAAGEEVEGEGEDDWASDGDLRGSASSPVRGSKRGRSFPFDLAIEQVYAVADPNEVD